MRGKSPDADLVAPGAGMEYEPLLRGGGIVPRNPVVGSCIPIGPAIH